MTVLRVQMNHEGRNGKDLIDCTFDREISRYENFGRANTKSVGQLLTEFFQFYSRQFDYQTMEVNVRLGGGFRVRDDVKKQLSKGRAPMTGRGERKLVVMDPFIRDRNVAGSCQGRHLLQVWLIFEALYLILSRGEFPKTLEPILVRDVAHNDLREILKATAEGPQPRQQQQTQKQQQHQQQHQPQEANLDPSTSTVKAGRHRGRERKEREKELEMELEKEREQEEERLKEKEEQQQAKEQRKQKQKELEQAKEQRRQKQKEQELENERKKTLHQPCSSDPVRALNSVAGVTVDPVQPKVLPMASTEVGSAVQGSGTVVEAEVDDEADGDTNDDADADQDNSLANGESKSRKRRVRKAIAREYYNSTLNETGNSVDTSATDSGSKSRTTKGSGSRPVTPVTLSNGIEKDHLERKTSSRRLRDESKRLSSGSETGSVGHYAGSNRKTAAPAQSATTTSPATVNSGEEPARPKIKVMQSELIKTLGEQKRHNDQLNHLIQVNQANQTLAATTGPASKEASTTSAAAIAQATATATAEAAAAATRSLSQTVASTPSVTSAVSATAQQGQGRPNLGKTHKLLLRKLGGGRGGSGARTNNNNSNNNNIVAAMPAGHEADTRWKPQAPALSGQNLKQQQTSLQLKQYPPLNPTVPSPLKTGSANPLKGAPSPATNVARGTNAIV